MNIGSRTFRPIWQFLIISCLLMGQALASAHELSHDSQGEPELCVTCSLGKQLQSAATAPEVTIPPARISWQAPVLPAAQVCNAPARSYLARAPPIDS